MAGSFKDMVDSLPPIPPAERERREQAAARLRERLMALPGYRDRAECQSDAFWRNFQASAVLNDE